eukprot:gene13045-17594_t
MADVECRTASAGCIARTGGRPLSHVRCPPPDVRSTVRPASRLWDHASRLLLDAVARGALPLPPAAGTGKVPDSPGMFLVNLADGRFLVIRRQPINNRGRINFLMLLGAVAAVVAIGAFPVVRRLTRRLERLQGSVHSW